MTKLRHSPDPDRTLSAPSLRAALDASEGIAVTIGWHPDRARIGEQAALLPGREGVWTLDRYAPLFYAPGQLSGTPLGHRCISRHPLRVRVTDGDGLVLTAPDARMRCAVDGVAVSGEVSIAPSAIDDGCFVLLGERVLLCVHRLGAIARLGHDCGLVGSSSAIARVREQIRQVARTTLPVLLLGESGTGKELVAQAIHAQSRRHAGPLVSVNMASLNESLAAAELFGVIRGAYTGAQQTRRGLFAEAHDGTLFLDEIGDTPATVQPMLLRTLESGEFRPLGAPRNERADVRLIAATDRELGEAFNQPLLRRLEAFTLRVPPLRQRREDVGVLAKHFLARFEEQQGARIELSAAVVQALARHDWPGNVRQLMHAVRRLALTPETEWPATLVELLQPATVAARRVPAEANVTSAQAPLRRAPRRRDPAAIGDDEVHDALAASGWCVRKAAERLHVSRTSFYALLERSRRVRRIDDIPIAEIHAALREAPSDPARWAEILRTPRESLRRRIKSLGLLAP